MKRKPPTSRRDGYSPAARVHATLVVLNESGGASVYDLAERLGVTPRTAIRYLRALENAGEPLDFYVDGQRRMWRLAPSRRHASVRLTTAQMIALALSRRMFDFLDGTGFKEDLDGVFRAVLGALGRRDFAAARDLEKKLHDVNEAPIRYDGRAEDVGDVVTALLRDEKLDVTYGHGAREKSFVLRPYTLLVYKKGLYVVGFSEAHGEIRTFALDAFSRLDRRRGDTFDYPSDYDPAKRFAGAFGLIKGAHAKVRVRFDPSMDRFVRRRRWHPSQRFARDDRGTLLELDVEGTEELKSWILSFGAKAEVLEPAALRDEVRAEATRLRAMYDDG